MKYMLIYRRSGWALGRWFEVGNLDLSDALDEIRTLGLATGMDTVEEIRLIRDRR